MIKLKVKDQWFDKWLSVSITLSLNKAASTFSLQAHKNQYNRFLFEPFSFLECEIWNIDEKKGINEQLITGYITNQTLTSKKDITVDSISGYTKTGVLYQNNMPKELNSYQWNSMTLRQISTLICDKYNISVYVHPGVGKDADISIEKIEYKENETLYQFLSRIGKIYNITVAHDEKGRLLLYKILNIIDASSEIIDKYESMELVCSGQQIWSECYAIKDKDAKDNGVGKYAMVTPELEGYAVSPFFKQNNKKQVRLNKTVVMPAKTGMTLNEYAEMELAKDAVAFSIKIEKEGWSFKNTNGGYRMVRGGFYLDVENEDLFFTKTKMLINEIIFTKEATGVEKAIINCVLPCVYTGKLPKASPFKI